VVPAGDYSLEVAGCGSLARRRVKAPAEDIVVSLEGLLGGVRGTLTDIGPEVSVTRIRLYLDETGDPGELNAHGGQWTPPSVEVRIPLECVHDPAPQLRLLSVPRGDVQAATRYAYALPRDEPIEGLYRFRSVPDGARLRFEGIDREGRDFTRELIYVGPGSMRIDWP
jgi:hypothetical protein